MENKIINQLKNIDNLPTLPQIVRELQKAIGDPGSDAKKIARIIEDDPSIMARILKIVNSAIYFPTSGVQVTSLQQAISRLGFNVIKNIVLSTSVFSAFPTSQRPAFKREEFWKHSICVGIIASVVYDFSNRAWDFRLSKDIIHLAGLLHDFGKILLENYFIEDFHGAIEKAKKEGLSLVEAEEVLYKTAHDEIGFWLADKWRLPWDITAVIRFHHNVEDAPKEHRTLIDLVHMADYICITEHLGDSANQKPYYLPHVRESLGLDLNNIGPLMEEVEKEVKKSELLLSILS